MPILSSIMEKAAVVGLKHRKDYTEDVRNIFQNLSAYVSLNSLSHVNVII